MHIRSGSTESVTPGRRLLRRLVRQENSSWRRIRSTCFTKVMAWDIMGDRMSEALMK